MKLIVGLGNPGKEYERTRHNAGFIIVDAFARQHELEFRSKKAVQSEVAEGDVNGQRILVCKPQTFMNASGRAVQAIMKKYPVTLEDLIVVYDDADLSFGDVRMKPGGGSAGQKGMESILALFPAGTNIPRIRFGIGRPTHVDIALEDFVLQPWSAAELTALPKTIERAIAHLVTYVG